MKIGFLTTEYAIGEDIPGGLGYYLRRTSIALARMGHEIHILYYTNKKSEVFVDQKVNIHIINNQRSWLNLIINRITQSKFKRTLDSIERLIRFRRHVNEILLEHDLDIIQSPNYEFPALFISTDVPIVIRCSSYRPLLNKYDQNKENIDNFLFGKLEVLQYRRAAGVFAPSKLLANILQKELDIKDVKVIQTPFYNEIRQFNYQVYEEELSEVNYLLYFGRLSSLKGVQILAQALIEVWKEIPNLFAVFVGPDDRLENNIYMSSCIRNTCIKYLENIKILSPLPHNKLYPIIKNARLVVLPTLFDNSPNTMLEAMGFGKVIVGTSGTSMDEFIEDGISGFLVKPGDSKDLAEKIIDIWSRKDLEMIGRLAEERVRELYPEKVLSGLLEFYNDLIGDS